MQAIGIATASGLSEPLGALLALLVFKPFVKSLAALDYVLAATGGVMLAVCVLELWPVSSIPVGSGCRCLLPSVVWAIGLAHTAHVCVHLSGSGGGTRSSEWGQAYHTFPMNMILPAHCAAQHMSMWVGSVLCSCTTACWLGVFVVAGGSALWQEWTAHSWHLARDSSNGLDAVRWRVTRIASATQSPKPLAQLLQAPTVWGTCRTLFFFDVALVQAQQPASGSCFLVSSMLVTNSYSAPTVSSPRWQGLQIGRLEQQ